MINANELRIGNYIYWDVPEKNNIPHNVFGIRKNGQIHTIPISLGKLPTDYLPIPLTPEILEKIFGYKDAYDYYFGVFNFKVSFGGNGLLFFYSHDYKHKGRQIAIKYLHQLQNLIFAFTGEELEINL